MKNGSVSCIWILVEVQNQMTGQFSHLNQGLPKKLSSLFSQTRGHGHPHQFSINQTNYLFLSLVHNEQKKVTLCNTELLVQNSLPVMQHSKNAWMSGQMSLSFAQKVYKKGSFRLAGRLRPHDFPITFT
jgi:hypothetical protein